MTEEVYLVFLPKIAELIERGVSPEAVYSLAQTPFAVPTEFYEKQVTGETINFLQNVEWGTWLYRFSKGDIEGLVSLLSPNAFEGKYSGSIATIKSDKGLAWLKRAQKLVRDEK